MTDPNNSAETPDESAPDNIPTGQPETAAETTADEPGESSVPGDSDSDANSPDAGEAVRDDSTRDDSSVQAGSDTDAPPTEETNDREGEAESVEDDEDLPEDEPLTPEIVEDEAIRGDFMLRWSVILLAFLLGVREVGDTRTLVHVRTGEYLASNGFWPPSNDVFSYTASDRSWVNLSWLSDLILAGVHGIGGMAAISFLTGLLAAITFYLLLSISRKDVPTWWNAVCAALALLMANLQFTALPEIITLLGSAWMLRNLLVWRDNGQSRHLWCTVASLFVWANLDSRAFIGWILLAAYVAGTVIQHTKKKKETEGGGESLSLRDGGIAVVAGLVAMLLNPFGWHSVLAPVALYGGDLSAFVRNAGDPIDPAIVQLRPITDSFVWSHLNIYFICAFVLTGVALVTCVLNRKRLDLGLIIALLAGVGLTFGATHELAIVALVAAVLASLNGQDWYRATFRQEYTTNVLEVLWSRAGRAITVLALAAVAWLGISGRLMQPSGPRIGFGFSPRLEANATAISKDLKSIHDGNLFSFRLDQGDLFIWGGRKVFIDSRVGIYRQGGDDSILRLHDQARNAVRSPSQAIEENEDKERAEWIGDRALWRRIFDRFEISQAAPRMWGRRPDYETYSDLITSDDWILTRLGGSMAIFIRTDSSNAELQQYAKDNRIDLPAVAFRTRDGAVLNTLREAWPQPRSAYQQFMSVAETPVSTDAEQAQHLIAHLFAGLNGHIPMTDGDALAAGILAVRHTNAALSKEPDNVVALRSQANAHSMLRNLETGIQNSFGSPAIGSQRHFLKLHALRQALLLEPDNVGILAGLAEEYASTQRVDLALEVIDRLLTAIRNNPEPDQRDLETARTYSDMKDRVAPQMERVEEMIKQVREEQPEVSPQQLANALHQQGFSRRALEILEEDRTYISQNMSVQMEYGLLLAQCGRLEDAEAQFYTLRQLDDDPRTAPWMLHASWISMARGDYDEAITMCRKRLRSLEEADVQGLIATLPLVPLPPTVLVENNDNWPIVRLRSGVRSMLETPEQTTMLRWVIATCYLESGRNNEAEETLQELLDVFPESRLRPITAKYLELLSGETVDAIPPSEFVPVLFAADEDEAESNEAKN